MRMEHITFTKGVKQMVDNSSMVMPVSPMYGYGNGGFGNGFGSDFWLILILLFAFGGWGGMGGFGGWGGGYADGNLLYPWMHQTEVTTNGFQNQATNQAISGLQNSITSGFGDVQLGIAGVNQNICQTGNAITSAVSNGFAQAEIANNGRQIANMQTAFANQTAMNQGFNGVQSQIAQNGYNTSSGLADVKYTIATEECNTRNASAVNTRDIIDSQTKGIQTIMDKLCQLELDGVKGQLAQAQRDNVGLQNQLNMANLSASQAQQTAQIQDNIIGELRSCPIPSMPVYGSQPIFTCPQNVSPSYGCGCNGTF